MIIDWTDKETVSLDNLRRKAREYNPAPRPTVIHVTGLEWATAFAGMVIGIGYALLLSL